MAAVAFVGLAAFPFLPVAPLPQVDFPTIQVTTGLAGASAENMASSVAAPIERQLSTISGISSINSQSSLGRTNIVIQFQLNRNIDGAALDPEPAPEVRRMNQSRKRIDRKLVDYSMVMTACAVKFTPVKS